MSTDPSNVAREIVSTPYLLDADAAKAYVAAIETPHRRAPQVNIHTDDEAARKAGYRAPIAAGEQTFALVMQLLVDRFGERVMRGGRVEIALLKPVFYGDRLTMRARVIEASGAALQLEVWTENDRGERVLTGTARVPKHSR